MIASASTAASTFRCAPLLLTADAIRLKAAVQGAAKKFGVKVVPGFTGSSIWRYVYSFPSVSAEAALQTSANDLIVAGVWSVFTIKLDAIPDLSDVQVIVYTEWPGQAPQIVQDQVTYPLTTQMLSVPSAAS